MKHLIENIYIGAEDMEIPKEHAKVYVTKEKHIFGFREEEMSAVGFIFIESQDGKIIFKDKKSIEALIFFMNVQTDRGANIYLIYDEPFLQETMTLALMYLTARKEKTVYEDFLYGFMSRAGSYSLRNAELNGLKEFYEEYGGIFFESCCGQRNGRGFKRT